MSDDIGRARRADRRRGPREAQANGDIVQASGVQVGLLLLLVLVNLLVLWVLWSVINAP
jgi:hypothetical protein